MAQRLREAPTALGVLEVVAEFYGPMPVGVTVSHRGRIFICFPRWGDPVDFTLAELRDGHTLPYPDAAANLFAPDAPAESL
ncbi:MAG: gluconolaconase, partial [Anaerolineae bacterium]|nr:gluconolaconase [Anaerolineae bacterium]